MAILRNTADWYWSVTDMPGVYSSRRNIYVPVDDPDYVAWSAMTSVGSPVANEAEIWPSVSVPPRSLPPWLFDGTTFAQPAVDAYTKTQLTAYSANARYNHVSSGVTITSIAPDKIFTTDVLSRNAINNGYDHATANPTEIIQWKMADGSFVAMDLNKLTTLYSTVSSFVQSCFNCESDTLTGIDNGSITTLAAIDAAYAAISNTFP